IRHHLSALRRAEDGDHAGRRVSDRLRLYRLRGDIAAEARRLLRVLFLRLRPMPADPGRALGAVRGSGVLRAIAGQTPTRAVYLVLRDFALFFGRLPPRAAFFLFAGAFLAVFFLAFLADLFLVFFAVFFLAPLDALFFLALFFLALGFLAPG